MGETETSSGMQVDGMHRSVGALSMHLSVACTLSPIIASFIAIWCRNPGVPLQAKPNESTAFTLQML